jgi:serine/threonine protein kinase
MTTQMKTGQWERTKQILERALHLAPDQRAAYLESVCGPDSVLRAEVESLIASYESAGSQFLAAPAPEILELTSAGSSLPTRAHQTVGHYKLIEEIGRGGMGQVWLAEQTAPVRRQVALKLIKVGMYDDEVLKRFEMERQSLAIMDHPSIAKVFDAGATPDGQPYFVMEYVPGVPITDYCDQKRLKIGERLELFIKVCEAVQHAHQKAIIHRDLKPANILVQEVDAKAVPRIIDFGLAKPTTPQIEGETLYTQVGIFVGTPGYMSPEQCDATTLDVDTRSDVYSLGVVLYVLLTGCLPFEAKAGKEQVINEMLRRVREEDPPPPSMKVCSEGETATTMAAARGAEPKQLLSLLRGDLDWVTMKALEKDRSRRYGTASELAADIGRHLRNEPVQARPANVSYRIGKYVRRHRLAVAVAAVSMVLTMVVLAGFAVMQSLHVRRLTRERDRADRIADFMTSLFTVSDPGERVGGTVTARALLDKAAKDVESGLAKDPELQARMMRVMGMAYLNLGLYPRAQSLFERSLRLDSVVLGPENPETLTTTQRLAWTFFREDRFADAERLQRKVLQIRRRLLGPEHNDTLSVTADLAATLDELGNQAEAEKMEREVLEKRKRLLGTENSYTLGAMDSLAVTLINENHLAEAEELEHGALAIQRRVYGDENLDTIHYMMNEAVIQGQMGRDKESEESLRRVLELQRRVLGPNQPETAVTLYNLASEVAKSGRLDEALSLLRESVDHGLLARWAVRIGEDPDLKALHGDPRFAAFVSYAKDHAARESN